MTNPAAHLRAAVKYRAVRKATGRCVQCGKPAAAVLHGKRLGVYCEKHRLEHAAKQLVARQRKVG